MNSPLLETLFFPIEEFAHLAVELFHLITIFGFATLSLRYHNSRKQHTTVSLKPQLHSAEFSFFKLLEKIYMLSSCQQIL